MKTELRIAIEMISFEYFKNCIKNGATPEQAKIEKERQVKKAAFLKKNGLPRFCQTACYVPIFPVSIKKHLKKSTKFFTKYLSVSKTFFTFTSD